MSKAEAVFILICQAKACIPDRQAWRKNPEILFPFNSLNIQLPLA